MTPKTSASKKAPAKAAAKAPQNSKSPKAPAKAGKASAKESKIALETAAGAPGEPAVDLDELEEAQDAAAAAASGGGGGDAAAMAAAATGSGEMSTSFKNFRHHPDMENFYRFIYENDLRFDALKIIDQILLDKQAAKTLKNTKSHAH